MEKFSLKLFSSYMRIKEKIKSAMKEEKGAAEIVAILLIIIVLFAVVVVFRKQLVDLVEKIFGNIITEKDELIESN